MTLTTLCSAPPIPSWPWPLTVPRTTSERDYLLIETFGLDNSFTKMTTSQWFCFCNTFSFFQRLDKGQDFEGKLIPKKFLPSLFHIIAQPVICTTSSSHERLRKQQHISIFYLFFIYWWPSTHQLLYCNVSPCINKFAKTFS